MSAIMRKHSDIKKGEKIMKVFEMTSEAILKNSTAHVYDQAGLVGL